jgi:uncharacterized protein
MRVSRAEARTWMPQNSRLRSGSVFEGDAEGLLAAIGGEAPVGIARMQLFHALALLTEVVEADQRDRVLPALPDLLGLGRGQTLGIEPDQVQETLKEARLRPKSRARFDDLLIGHLDDPVGVLALSRQHFLNFLPLPQGQGSLRPTSR